MKNPNSGNWKRYGLMSLKLTFLACTMVPLVISTAMGEEATASEKFDKALKGDWGQIKINVRYRWEYADQEGSLKTADGDSIRLRLGYLTPELAGFQGYLEGLANTYVFSDDYNNTVNGKKDYVTIADPDEAAVNQAWLSYGAMDTTLKAGRQYIAYDNQRFVSPCAFRQMEQSFDAVTLVNKSIGNFTINGAYLVGVLNIKNQDIDMESPLLNLKYSFPGIGALTGYGYWLDYDDPADSGKTEFAYSTETFGLRFSGSAGAGEAMKLLYTAEYASQSDYGENPNSFTADYYHVNGGLVWPMKDSLFKNVTAKVGYEVLGSDNGVPFQTPLGANHKFNGWADVFGINKPADGLKDMYVSFATTVKGVKLDLAYHDFQADNGDADYGTEFDVKLGWKITKNYSAMVSYAWYDADDYQDDVRKFWFELMANF